MGSSSEPGADAPSRVAVSGASGLVGSALVASLRAAGCEVRRLVRRPAAGPEEVEWSPREGRVDVARLDGVDAFVHLAGENIASGRWTERRKRRIRDSRVQGTRVVAEALAAMEPRPRTLVGASAIGYYGDRGDEPLDESSPPGSGFLAETAVAWERGVAAAEEAGIRVVRLRIGVVLAADGGALPRMLTPFRLGLGGRVGSGRQYWSWVTLDDLVGILEFALRTPRLRGPVNAVAPQPVTNAELTRTLGRVLGRPTLLPLPAFAVRALLGEMGRELLLSSTRVIPRELQRAGYAFRHPDLEEGLRAVLDRPRS